MPLLFVHGAQDELLARDQVAQSEAGGGEQECQASAGEGVGDARSRGIATFNKERDYVLAAVCRLETEDLVDQGQLSLSGMRRFSLFWQGKKWWAALCPVSRSAVPGGDTSSISLPHPSGGGVLSSNQPRRTALQSMD